MRDPDVIIIGAGQAGLVMSRSLTARGIDHVVLERGRIGERWYSERWHSLNLLTTNACSALPGAPQRGDPNAFMPASAFASYLTGYAWKTHAPVITGVEVSGVEPASYGYRVSTTAGRWRTRAVVIATGACDTPFRPLAAQDLDPSIVQINPSDYREPAQLPEGGVLIVGASSSGAQLAEEIHASGRPVTLAVGNHTPAPRRYRGRDIYEWLETTGILDEPAVEGVRLEAARRQPALQVVGRADNRDLNLRILSGQGVRLVGRVTGLGGSTVRFGDDLGRTMEAAHARMVRVLDRIDDCINRWGLESPEADPAARVPFAAPAAPLSLDLARAGIRTVVWATGYIRRYPWLKVPVLDSRGEIIQQGGVTASPGLYTMGLNFMRRRRSAFINGCGFDAADLAPLINEHLDQAVTQVA
jgi:putative flavoprotein involved in K+ transport